MYTGRRPGGELSCGRAGGGRSRVFEAHRPAMLGLAYRMLGDVGRAQDMVQEAWLRWHQREADVDSPKAW